LQPRQPDSDTLLVREHQTSGRAIQENLLDGSLENFSDMRVVVMGHGIPSFAIAGVCFRVPFYPT
jgi:hypothetical protein